MDIRFINKSNEIINVTEMSIKVIGSNFIGIDGEKNVIIIENYGSEEEAKEELKKIVDRIKEMHNWYVGITEQPNATIIDLRKEE